MSVVWLGFLLYLFLAGVIYGLIVYVSLYLIPSIPALLIGRVLIVIAVLVGVYGLLNARDIKTTEVTMWLPNLPDSWKGRKAVFISDVHLGQVNGVKFSRKVVNKIQEINPDLILNAGDFYDGPKVDPVSVAKPFSELRPPLGHFYVAGNHEEYGDTPGFMAAVKSFGFTVLNNEKVEVDGLQIAGVDYVTTTKQAEFERILKDIKLEEDKPSLLIKHVPLNLETAEEAGVDLQVSGHTHRAQVFPLSLITKAVYKGYDYGLKPLGALQVLVTSGAGTWGPPLRVGTKSEIVVITFK